MIVQGAGVIEWVAQSNQASFTPDVVGIGQVVEGRLIAGVAYDNYNGSNIVGSLTVKAPPTRKFWWAVFSYAFESLGCSRITAYVEADNDKSLHIMGRLGFELEGTLKDAGANGSDVNIYRMWKQNCRMLNWRYPHGQENQNAATA